MEQQLQALMQPNVAVFDEFIKLLMSPNNQERNMAEQLFDTLKTNNPAVCVQQLTGSMLGSQLPENRSFSAIMLRRVLSKGNPPAWTKLNQAQRDEVKMQLLQGIQQEPQREVVRKICDTASDIAQLAVAEGQWKELVPFIFQCVNSKDPKHMESALIIFSETAAVILDEIDDALPNFLNVLMECLNHSETAIRLAALRAVAATLLYTEKQQVLDMFKPVLPIILGVLGKLLQEGDEASAQEAIALLLEVADSQPQFLKSHIQEVLNAMLQIANVETLEDSTRQMAVEFFVTLCESRDRAPGLLKKVQQQIEGFFTVLMMFLLDLEDVQEWHTSQEESSEDSGHNDKFDFAQEALDRIALTLGGRQLVPLAGQMLPQWLQDEDWRKRHAVLICLAQIAEGCEKKLQTQKEVLTAMCIQGLQDANAKVKWAACQAIGQLCTDLGPELQYDYHQQIIPALWTAMEDFGNPRVQAHATAALVNFCDGIEADVLQSYLDELIKRLIQLLQNGTGLVQIGALTAIASVADCVEGAFNRYYETVMPLLMHMLSIRETSVGQMMLRAKALEAISLVCMKVDAELFRPHAAKVMEVLQQLHASELQPQDPIIGYMYQAGARLCKTLGKEFIPYLGVVLPPLLKAAALQPEIQVRDDDSEDEDEEEDDDVQVIPLAGKRVQIKTSTMEDKATACSMLSCYASELQEGFFPYVQQVLEIMVPCLKFFFHEEVRKAAIQNMPELLKCSIKAMELGQADGNFVKGVVKFMWEPVLEALNKEFELDVEDFILEALDEIIVAAGKQFITLQEMEQCFTILKQVLENSKQRRQDRMKRTREAGEELDEEDVEALNDEEKMEQELLESVNVVIGSALKKYGDDIVPALETLLPYFAELVDPSQQADFQRIGVCVMDDILDYTQNAGLKYVNQFMPVLVNGCASDNPDLRQCAVYGVGLVAERHPTLYPQFHPQVLECVMNILKDPNANSEDNQLCTDNAISALGKIIKSHSSLLNGQDFVGTWLGNLPIIQDAAEATAMHGQLVDMVEMNDSRVVSNLPQVAKIFIKVLAQGTKLVGVEHGNKMVGFLKQMETQLPAGFIAQIAAELPQQEQEKFRRLMMGQTQG
eukprot:TRINITY_DN20853_c0_g1_i5.p1 TRINITY_DN20853_c0_g1~~TRINITY_DN20853_c0_g1_i5.p1  ORF type:complete len:1109 (+),score=260.05 TRINITY_DN20853_c0_g1_i5:163-3489(+)